MIDERGDDILREPQNHEPQPRPDMAQDPCDADAGWVDVVVRDKCKDKSDTVLDAIILDDDALDNDEVTRVRALAAGALLVAVPLALGATALLIGGAVWLWRVAVALFV